MNIFNSKVVEFHFILQKKYLIMDEKLIVSYSELPGCT